MWLESRGEGGGSYLVVKIEVAARGSIWLTDALGAHIFPNARMFTEPLSALLYAATWQRKTARRLNPYERLGAGKTR